MDYKNIKLIFIDVLNLFSNFDTIELGKQLFNKELAEFGSLHCSYSPYCTIKTKRFSILESIMSEILHENIIKNKERILISIINDSYFINVIK